MGAQALQPRRPGGGFAVYLLWDPWAVNSLCLRFMICITRLDKALRSGLLGTLKEVMDICKLCITFSTLSTPILNITTCFFALKNSLPAREHLNTAYPFQKSRSPTASQLWVPATKEIKSSASKGSPACLGLVPSPHAHPQHLCLRCTSLQKSLLLPGRMKSSAQNCFLSKVFQHLCPLLSED